MKKTIKSLINSLAVLGMILIGGAAFAPAVVYAVDPPAATPTTPAPAAPVTTNPSVTEICEGVRLTGGNCAPEAPGTGVSGIIQTVINLLSLVVGVVAVIMIVIGGLKYVLSSGDAGNTKSAKDTILFALVGLVIVALAQVLVRFVLTRIK